MKYYRITKSYQGGSSIYYIKLKDVEKITQSMLERIGDNTDGGHNYGYKIKAKKIKQIPKGKSKFVLRRSYTKNIY